MIIYLVGISCVGKTTIGRILADKIEYSFFDLDEEVERYYQKPIERIQDECFTMQGFREKASIVLDRILTNEVNSIIAGTPSGLKYSYLQVYKKHKNKKALFSICLLDSPENILNRLTFYDKDSKPIKEELDESKKEKYIKKIKADYNYFKDSYKRADLRMEIKNIHLENIPDLIIHELIKRINCQLPTRNKVKRGESAI